MSSSSSADDEKPHHCLKKVDKSIHYKNKLKKRIKVTKQETKSLRFEIETFKTKVEKLTKDATERYELVKKTSVEKTEFHVNLNKQIAALTGELNYTKSLLEARNTEWNAVAAEITKVEVELANVTKELKQVRAEEHDVEAHEKYLEELAAKEAKQIAELEALQAKENAEAEALNQRTNEEHAKLHALDDELKKADKELEKLNKEIKQKEVDIEHLGGHVEEITRRKIPPVHTDLVTHQNLVGGKEAAVVKVETELGVILQRIPVETGERTDLLNFYNTHTTSLHQLKERVATLEHDVVELQHTKQALHESYTQSIEAHKTELTNLDTSNATLVEVVNKLKVTRKENDVLFAEINELKAKIKTLAAEEAKVEGVEAELAAKEAAEAAELAALRQKEKQEREAVVALKKSLVEARHLLQEHELHSFGHKQTYEKLTVDLSGLHQCITTREAEIAGVLQEHAVTNQEYTDTSKKIDTATKQFQVLERQEASLKHLETDLDEKIKELVHKEATEHQELENNRAKLGHLAIELDHLRVEIVKASATLASKTKEHESKVVAAQADIKTHEYELSHRAEVHKQREKDVVAFEAKAKKHTKHHDKNKKKDKKKKKKAKHHKHQKKHHSSSSSSSSSSD